MKPLIGVTSDLVIDTNEGRPWNSSRLLTSYCEAIVAAGGAPVILPLGSPDICEPTLDRLDGIILSGGEDIPAEILGEPAHARATPLPIQRWESETAWLQSALTMDKPLLGICLGMQIMAVVAGGKMFQDIPDERPGSLVHGTPSRLHRHEIEILPGTRLAEIAPKAKIEITSSHHQAIKTVPAPYRLAASSTDGLIEAFEHPEKDFAIGVQWHPERDPRQPDWLLQSFVRHCARASTSSVTGCR